MNPQSSIICMCEGVALYQWPEYSCFYRNLKISKIHDMHYYIINKVLRLNMIYIDNLLQVLNIQKCIVCMIYRDKNMGSPSRSRWVINDEVMEVDNLYSAFYARNNARVPNGKNS